MTNLPTISTVFYHPQVYETGILSKEESRHAIRVLRLKKGDEIYLADGKGGLFKAEILEPDPKKCIVKVIDTLSTTRFKPSLHLHLAVAPTKNSERFEWFLEKAIEIGISEITPMICEHSERRIIKTDRLEKLAIAAMKQSLNLFLPEINSPVSFHNFLSSGPALSNKKESEKMQKFIAHHSGIALKNLYQKGKDAIILIGPEGDFSEKELASARANGFVEVSLGNNRLRTETAAIVACHTIKLMNEE